MNDKLPKQNIFWVSGIATKEKDALAIGFFKQSGNQFGVYYLSISGPDIRIIKKSEGDL